MVAEAPAAAPARVRDLPLHRSAGAQVDPAVVASGLPDARRARLEWRHPSKATKAIEVQTGPAEAAGGAVGILAAITSITATTIGTSHSGFMTATTTTMPTTMMRSVTGCTAFTRGRAGTGVESTSATSCLRDRLEKLGAVRVMRGRSLSFAAALSGCARFFDDGEFSAALKPRLFHFARTLYAFLPQVFREIVRGHVRVTQGFAIYPPLSDDDGIVAF